MASGGGVYTCPLCREGVSVKSADERERFSKACFFCFFLVFVFSLHVFGSLATLCDGGFCGGGGRTCTTGRSCCLGSCLRTSCASGVSTGTGLGTWGTALWSFSAGSGTSAGTSTGRRCGNWQFSPFPMAFFFGAGLKHRDVDVCDLVGT